MEDYYDDFMCYLLDTGHDVFENHPEVFKYRHIIVECTYIFPEQKEAACCNKHMLWQDLLAIVLAHPYVTFILVHWSLRYKDEEITKFFEEQATVHGFKNVICWLN
jgi:ribonuclease Z